jgi:hypothetical protein
MKVVHGSWGRSWAERAGNGLDGRHGMAWDERQGSKHHVPQYGSAVTHLVRYSLWRYEARVGLGCHPHPSSSILILLTSEAGFWLKAALMGTPFGAYFHRNGARNFARPAGPVHNRSAMLVLACASGPETNIERRDSEAASLRGSASPHPAKRTNQQPEGLGVAGKAKMRPRSLLQQRTQGLIHHY